MSQLEIDRLSPSELTTLDVYQHLGVLSELLGEIKNLAQRRCDALAKLAAAKTRVLYEPTPQNKAAMIAAKLEIDQLAIFAQARRQQSSIYQTMTRTLPNQ